MIPGESDRKAELFDQIVAAFGEPGLPEEVLDRIEQIIDEGGFVVPHPDEDDGQPSDIQEQQDFAHDEDDWVDDGWGGTHDD